MTAGRVPSTGTNEAELRPAGIEPATYGFEVRCQNSVTAENSGTCESSDEALGVLLGVILPKLSETDPGLAAVIEMWANLPHAIKAGIVAMVKAARG